MPSKSPKVKSHPRQPKRVTDDDGWTHIVKGPQATTNHFDTSAQFQELRLGRQLTLNEVCAQQRKYQKIWTESECCKDLHHILHDHILTREHLRIDKCICLGLGSITEGRESPRHQFAALLWLLDELKQKHAIGEVIFQDPAFTAADITYLESLSYKVVETPAAMDAIGRSTFLFGPHLESTVYATALERGWPGVCVGGDVRAFLERMKPSGFDADKKRVWENTVFERFGEAMHSKPIPAYGRDAWWYYTNLYWLKDSDG